MNNLTYASREFHASTFAANNPIEDSYAVTGGIGPSGQRSALHSHCKAPVWNVISDHWVNVYVGERLTCGSVWCLGIITFFLY